MMRNGSSARCSSASGTRRAVCSWALCALSLLVTAPLAGANERRPFQVIVHRDLPVTALPTRFVADVFLKKVTRWEDGSSSFPVDLPSSSKTRIAFSEQVLKRPVSAVRSYWQQRIFSGRDVPPPELETEAQAVRYVADHPGGIAYVSPATELRGVKAITLH